MTNLQVVGERAKIAAGALAITSTADKNAGLIAIADALTAQSEAIVAANATDIERARSNGTEESLIDRLTLTPDRVTAIAQAVRDVAELPDPVGEVVRGYTLANGLRVRQLRVPIGVIGMIYEARPNVTVDAGVLALKSGNAALLRGSSSAIDSNTKLVQVMQVALASAGLPADAIQLVPGTTHESVNELLTARGLVDLIIPRGGAALIQSVVRNATVPVIETGVGNCHVYIDETADIQEALEILLNAKTQRPSVCNAAETFLVHAHIADAFLPVALTALTNAGVTVHGDDAVQIAGKAVNVDVAPVTNDDWAREYMSLDIAAGVVDSLDDAIAHIQRWSSGHTEAIISDSASSLSRFADEIDSAVIMQNASTRFTDGAEFGFGAEIGISTQKMHARGPMGLPELTTTKYVVSGDGQVRP